MTVDIQCTTKPETGREHTTRVYAAASLTENATMSKPEPNDIALALADALPRDADRRSELVAIGMVATALIATTHQEERAELVEFFCNQLRASVANELN